MKKELIFSKKVLVLIVGIMIICAGMQKPENTVREEKGYNYETTKDKVRFEGVGKITSESSTEIAEIINTSKEENTKLIIELDNSYDKSVMRPDKENMSIEDAQKLLRQQRANVKEYYTRTNNEILDKLDLSQFDISVKADSYAPYIIGEFNNDITTEDIDNIYDLAEEEMVSVIYVKNTNNEAVELDSAVEAIDATNIRTNSSTNGDGIVIGILDCGIVDKKNRIFSDVLLAVRDEWFYDETVSTHATQVAACALAVAPQASILSVEISGEPSGEIEWLLDNGANIINMSFGYKNIDEYGRYTSESAYCDYIARDNWVTFTCSAGNRGFTAAQEVTPPNGYNTITVGACTNDGIRCGFSSYEEHFSINFPNF